MTCPHRACQHPLSAHGSGCMSTKTETGSVEVPVWICAYCNCVLSELPAQGGLWE